MKKLIGGQFKTQEDANRAYEALQRTGFAVEDINQFVHKPRQKTARATDVKVQHIARNAFLGGLIGAAIGGFLGFLVGSGIIPLPSLEPGTVDNNSFLLITSIVSGIVGGGLTGIILGVASKLLRSREKAEVMTKQIEKRGVLVTVNVNDSQNETKARRVMEENGAEEIGNPSDNLDLDAWFSPNEINPSLRNLVNTR